MAVETAGTSGGPAWVVELIIRTLGLDFSNIFPFPKSRLWRAGAVLPRITSSPDSRAPLPPSGSVERFHRAHVVHAVHPVLTPRSQRLAVPRQLGCSGRDPTDRRVDVLLWTR